jgi:hypothetical protein
MNLLRWHIANRCTENKLNRVLKTIIPLAIHIKIYPDLIKNSLPKQVYYNNSF